MLRNFGAYKKIRKKYLDGKTESPKEFLSFRHFSRKKDDDFVSSSRLRIMSKYFKDFINTQDLRLSWKYMLVV